MAIHEYIKRHASEEIDFDFLPAEIPANIEKHDSKNISIKIHDQILSFLEKTIELNRKNNKLCPMSEAIVHEGLACCQLDWYNGETIVVPKTKIENETYNELLNRWKTFLCLLPSKIEIVEQVILPTKAEQPILPAKTDVNENANIHEYENLKSIIDFLKSEKESIINKIEEQKRAYSDILSATQQAASKAEIARNESNKIIEEEWIRTQEAIDQVEAEKKQIQMELSILQHDKEALVSEIRRLTSMFGSASEAGQVKSHKQPIELKAPIQLVEALASQGLRYPPTWPARLLAAALAARDVGSLLLLAGSTGAGKSRMLKEIGGMLHGAGVRMIPVRPEWLAATDLLGYVDPIRDTFAPTDFVQAVRDATRAMMESLADGDEPAPWFVVLDELNLARVENFGADLLSALERAPTDPDRVLRLFPADLRDGWRLEYDALAKHTDRLSPREGWRLEMLRRLFDPAHHRQRQPMDAHLLRLPANLVVAGTLNTDRHTHDLSPKVFDRSFVLQLPAPSVDDVLSLLSPQALIPCLRLPPTPLASPVLADLRLKLKAAIEALRPAGLMPSHRIGRNAEAYARHAMRLREPSRIAGDLVHLLLLPRLEASVDIAKKALEALDKVTRGWGDPELTQEIASLQVRAREGRHGEFRGLS